MGGFLCSRLVQKKGKALKRNGRARQRSNDPVDACLFAWGNYVVAPVRFLSYPSATVEGRNMDQSRDKDKLRRHRRAIARHVSALTDAKTGMRRPCMTGKSTRSVIPNTPEYGFNPVASTIARAVANLSHEQRAVIIARYVWLFGSNHGAKAIGITLDAWKARIYAAKTALRDALGFY